MLQYPGVRFGVFFFANYSFRMIDEVHHRVSLAIAFSWVRKLRTCSNRLKVKQSFHRAYKFCTNKLILYHLVII